MNVLRLWFALIVLMLTFSFSALAQEAPRRERFLGISSHQKPAAPLPAPQGLQDHAANGKLVLSLDDSIRLALSNNTDVRIDRSQIEFAQNNLHRARGPFDPLATSGFADNRTKSPAITQIQGALIPDILVQTTILGYAQTFQTGTNFQTSFNASKLSTNNSLEEAQKSYDHDKKALGLGALPPLDIYRSESQVASRRVGVIQAEYALKQAEDQFRQVVGADLDPAIR